MSKRVRINAGVLGSENQYGLDEGPGFSLTHANPGGKLVPTHHHIKLDGRDLTSAFKPSEFTRVAS